MRELSATLRRQLPAKPDEVAESIQMIAKLGEPTESLQVGGQLFLKAALGWQQSRLMRASVWPWLPPWH